VTTYRGRFAPSPTGPLHRGSLVAALASWLDARAHGGRWLVRIEDLDPPREEPGAAWGQVDALRQLGLVSDEPVLSQSTRHKAYESALGRLERGAWIYPCSCSRLAVERAAFEAGLAPNVYSGRCRSGPAAAGPLALRFRVPPGPFGIHDRACGAFTQVLQTDVGDFVVRRADGLWSYQLAVVVDDAEQAITDVVRGADLLDNTPRQVALQRALQLPTPRYLHVALVLGEGGQKLSKQTGARALDLQRPLDELREAWLHLGFEPLAANAVPRFLDLATARWAERWVECRVERGGGHRHGGDRRPDTIGTP
jgi:glutamyl-Q tRNA(Asp) synthetase